MSMSLPASTSASIWRRAALALLLAAALHPAHAADTSAPAPADAHQAALSAAVQAIEASQVRGPAEIKLRDQAVLKLPAGYLWVPEPAAGQFMKALGNRPGESELGLILPQSNDQGWIIVADYEASGYIKDDDAKNWDVDGLFKSLKEGTEAGNERRRSEGFPEIEIVAWVEKPRYTAENHQLIWSMTARNKDAPANEAVGINYNTYALGREGYITLNLLTDLDQVAKDKGHTQALLAALQFTEGKRYTDYNASTDKTAEYGLAALVGGLAAKKLGMFALAAGLFAKFAKVILLGGAGVAALATKLFKRKKDQA